MSSKLVAYTDGGSDNNPGVSGWAFYIPSVVKCNGYSKLATNNEMELRAMIECLKYLGDRESVVYSDSTYVVKGLTEWIYGWIKTNWITSSKTPVANQDLWKELFSYYNPKVHEIRYVKGHSNVEGNEICDQLVQEAKKNKLERNEISLQQDSNSDEVLYHLSNLIDSYGRLTEYDKNNLSQDLYNKLIKFLHQLKNE